MYSTTARTHTSLELEARGNPYQSQPPECNCMDCTVRFLLLLPQDIDLLQDDKPSDHHHRDFFFYLLFKNRIHQGCCPYLQIMI